MSKSFTITYLSTLVIIRILSFIFTQFYVQTYSDFWHHLYTGVILLIVLWIISDLLNKKISVILLAIAIALIIDELILLPVTLICRPEPIGNYWSWYSWLGMIGLSLIVLIKQKSIILKFLK
ncbi:hypothetical protein KKA15_05325 [Patescibacteria group bacterium]|nr:hypothetical protein [Patescibacteria group bacterium]